MALAWAALGLLGLLATVAPEQAVAQSEITLVGNAGQPSHERHTASFQGTVDHAQQFTTGPNAAGDTLTKVEFLSNDAQGHTFSAQLCEANNTGETAVPDPMNCQTLSTTSSFAQNSVVVFTPPSGMTITLAASTRYVVVLSENNSPSAVVDILSTQANNQNGETGWTLADVFDWKQNGTTWMKQGSGRDALIMDVKGYANSGPPGAVRDVVVVPAPRSASSLTVSWTAPENTGKPAPIAYDVRYREDVNWTTVRQDDAANTSLIITGLRPNGYYDVQVLALNGDGSGPWSSTAEAVTSPRSETVLANHPLIPDDLGVGDAFRLLYLTGDTNDVYTTLTAATGTNIQDYNNFAIDPTLHIVETGNFLRSWGEAALWQVPLVSMPGHDARLLTDTTWTPTDRGVPIYWLNGARVADDYADFYDGTWADEANPRDGLGQPYPLDGPAPWTGTDHDGTELFDGAASRALGQATVGVGGLGSSAVGAGPLNGRVAFASTEERPLYGLWQVMVVGENLRLVDNTHVPAADRDPGNDDRAAARAQLFTTGTHPSGYGIEVIRVSAGEDDAFLGPVALYTTDANGKPDPDGLHATLNLDTDTYWRLRAPVGTVLKPNTTYALVFQGDSGSYPELRTLGADGENVPAEGWSIADALLYHNGTSWVENPDGRSLSITMIGPRMETDGPALVSATVGAAGNAVTLAFDEDLALPSDSAEALTFLASLASAFAVSADGSGVAVSGLTASGTDGLTLGLSGVIVQGQAVTLTYTDPTAGDDAIALQDGLGNETPTFTTGIDGVPDVINNSTINVPTAPRRLAATASGNTRINLSWTAPASNGGFAITGYRIEVSSNGGSSWRDLAANTRNTNTTFAHTVAAGTTRHYRVSAINTQGTGASSNVANATTGQPTNDGTGLILSFGTHWSHTVKVLESDTVWHRFTVDLRSRPDAPPDGNPQQPLTIPLVVTHVGGAGPEDYTALPANVKFEVGQSTTFFRMRAIPDDRREPGEGLRLDFGQLPAGLRKSSWGPYETIEFVDQDLPRVTALFGAESYTATEGGAAARVSIHLSEPVEIEPLDVRLSVQHGGGATTGDYSVPTVVRFAVGEQTKTIAVTATDDTDDDDGESVTLSFVEDPNDRVVTGVGSGRTTVALEDNDGPAAVAVSFGAATYTATEGGADARVRVQLDAAPGRPVTVPLTKAHAGGATTADYSVQANVAFGPNETSKTFLVTATDDADPDGGESVRIGFGALPDGVLAGRPAAAVVTLADGTEQTFVVSFGTNPTFHVQAREGNVGKRIGVYLGNDPWGSAGNAEPRRPVTIPLVVTYRGGATGADHTPIPASVTFEVGSGTAGFNVRALPDGQAETGESLRIDFGALPPGVTKGRWGYETIEFVDEEPVSLRVSGPLLTMRYPGALDGGSTPSGGDFVVVAGPPGGEAVVPVTSVSVDGEAVLLGLARPVAADETVTLTYLTGAMHPIRDTQGLAAPLADEPVRNETGASGLPAQAGPAGGTAIRTALAGVPEAAQMGAGTERLDLSSQGLTDVSALAGLSGVLELDLADNAIADLSPLAGLTGLQVLNLSGNRVADIATLAGLTELERLNLSDNRIEGLSPLAGLSGLKVLDLSGNRIEALSPLAGLTGLERLNLSGNGIGELLPLAGLGGLQVLLLDGNGIADVLGLSPLAGLENLGLSGNRIADIGLLGQLRGLRRLDLSGNAVEDISALGEVSGLLWLRLPGNPVSDIAPLGRLEQLRWLWLDPATAPGMEAWAVPAGRGAAPLWIEREPAR